MKTTEKSEDYLKWIYILSDKNKVRGSELARVMGVSRPTVSVALKSLADKGYITLDRSRAVTLTIMGEAIGRMIYEKNLFFTHLLIRMGVNEETATADACRLEHAVSAETFEAFKTLEDYHEAVK